MRDPGHPRRAAWAIATAVVLATALVGAAAAQDDRKGRDKDAKDKGQEATRPKLTLRADPVVSFSPSRVVLTAELTGGAGDFEEYYCPTVAWEWGDGTSSEASSDCEPYEAGKSAIKRRFSVQHVFRAGEWQVHFRLKQHDKTVAAATTTIQVRAGVRDMD